MGSGSSKSNKLGPRTRNQKGNKPPISTRSMSFPSGKKKNHETKDNAMSRTMTDGDLPLGKSLEKTTTPDDYKVTPPNGSTGVLGDVDLNDNGILFRTPLTARRVNGSAASKLMSEYQNVLKPSELYNLITAETWQGYPQIHDSAYLLLLDCRERKAYEEMHIVTARHHSALYSEYGLLLPRQLKLFNIIILYSHSGVCQNLLEFSKKLAEDNIEHFLLDCGTSEFLTRFPFLASTQPNSYLGEMRKTLQTMPSEIISGRLYQGNAKHALDPYIVKSLGITHIVNVTLEHPNRFEDTVEYMRIQLDDKPHVNLQTWLPKTTEFMNSAIGPCTVDFSQTNRKNSNGSADDQIPDQCHETHGVVLVHCNLGRSRSSTVVLGYLMKVHKLTLDQASSLLKDCRSTVRPNVGFLDQLLTYEKEIFGKAVTRLNDLPF